MAEQSPPPWHLVAECVLGWVRVPPAVRSLVPTGLKALPGPGALVAVRYPDSPVGPYLELSIGVPARLGARPGLNVVLQWVSTAEARQAYRANWGMPAALGSLLWHAEGEARVLRCDEAGMEVRGQPVGPRLPAIVPVPSVQRRADGPVVLRRRFMAMVRLAGTVVTMDQPVATPVASSGASSVAGLGLETLAGRHAGAVMGSARILARPARHPLGWWSSLAAPLRAIDPALAGGPSPQLLQLLPSRALSSAG